MTKKAGFHGVPGGENMLKFEDGSLRYMSIYEAKLIRATPRGAFCLTATEVSVATTLAWA